MMAVATVDEALPNVLILGDSISIGYTQQVREGLKDKANVIRPNTNCGSTGMGLEGLKSWLGDKHWGVIHFNWGLWDLCYRNPESKTQGNRDKVNGKLTTSLEDSARVHQSWRCSLQARRVRQTGRAGGGEDFGSFEEPGRDRPAIKHNVQ